LLTIVGAETDSVKATFLLGGVHQEERLPFKESVTAERLPFKESVTAGFDPLDVSHLINVHMYR
jgi:hypothetical protein